MKLLVHPVSLTALNVVYKSDKEMVRQQPTERHITIRVELQVTRKQLSSFTQQKGHPTY